MTGETNPIKGPFDVLYTADKSGDVHMSEIIIYEESTLTQTEGILREIETIH